MKTKEKALLIWILVVVAIGVLLSHFCGGAVHAFEHFIASSLLSMPGVARISTASFGVQFLHGLL